MARRVNAESAASIQHHHMKTKEVIAAAHRLSKPYRVRNGEKFRLKDVDPGDTGELQSGQAACERGTADRCRGARGAAGHALRTGSLVVAAHLSGDGCGGEGRDDQARDVGGESAGVPGVIVQGAHFRRSRSRLSVALSKGAPGTRTDRYFQPQLLRGDAGGAGASGVSGRAKA